MAWIEPTRRQYRREGLRYASDRTDPALPENAAIITPQLHHGMGHDPVADGMTP